MLQLQAEILALRQRPSYPDRSGEIQQLQAEILALRQNIEGAHYHIEELNV